LGLRRVVVTPACLCFDAALRLTPEGACRPAARCSGPPLVAEWRLESCRTPLMRFVSKIAPPSASIVRVLSRLATVPDRRGVLRTGQTICGGFRPSDRRGFAASLRPRTASPGHLPPLPFLTTTTAFSAHAVQVCCTLQPTMGFAWLQARPSPSSPPRPRCTRPRARVFGLRSAPVAAERSEDHPARDRGLCSRRAEAHRETRREDRAGLHCWRHGSACSATVAGRGWRRRLSGTEVHRRG